MHDRRVQGWLGLALALAVTCAGSNALAEAQFLAVGRFHERGPQTRGDGTILAGALEYELTHAGKFQAVADPEARRSMKRIIAKTNKHKTDERYWIELGHEVGASHLLRGAVWEAPEACFARVKLITLKTGTADVTSTEPYDCTASDLKALAGELSFQLIGSRTSPPRKRPHPIRKRNAPLHIGVVGDKTYVDGKPVDVPPAKEAPPAKGAAPDAGAAVPPPPAAAPPPAAVTPEPEPDPVLKPSPEPVIDADKWPGFAPPGAEAWSYSTYDLARTVHRRAPLAAGLILLVPVVFVFIGAIAVRIRRDAGVSVMQLGLSLSVLLLCLDLAVIGFYSYALGRPILEDVDLVLVAAPFLALLVWLIGGRMVVTYSEMRLWHRIFTVILYSAYFSVVVLLASQIHLPVVGVLVATLIFWGVVRFANRVRKKRRALRQARALSI